MLRTSQVMSGFRLAYAFWLTPANLKYIKEGGCCFGKEWIFQLFQR